MINKGALNIVRNLCQFFIPVLLLFVCACMAELDNLQVLLPYHHMGGFV